MGEHVPVVSTRGSRKHRSSIKGDSMINETTEHINSHENEWVENVKKLTDTDSDRKVSILDDGGKMLLPRHNDQEILSEQDDDRGKEMGCTDKEIQHFNEICDPVGHTVTQECEHTEEEIDQALNSGDKNKMHTATFYSQAGVEEEIIDIGSTSSHKYSCEINTCSKSVANIGPQFDITAESHDNNCSFIFIGHDKMHVKDVFIELCSWVTNSFFHNKMYFDAVNLPALENEPAAVSKNSIVVEHPYLALIINSEYMHLVLHEGHIFPDCQINAAMMGMKSCIFCTDSFVTYKIPLSFILALFSRRCMLRTSFLNVLKTLSLYRVSPELLEIDANKDLDDKTLSLCHASPELLEIDANKDLDDKILSLCHASPELLEIDVNKDLDDRTLSLCHASPELLEIDANKDQDDKTLSLCHASPELLEIDANQDQDDKTLSLCIVSPELLEIDANQDQDDKTLSLCIVSPELLEIDANQDQDDKTLSLCIVSPELLEIDANQDQDDKTLSLCIVSPELLETDANIDLDDKVCCVYCAKEVRVKNVGDLKNGQHLTRPGQSHHSWCFSGSCISFLFSCISFLLSFLSLDFPFYRHHLLLKDIVFYSDQTAMLTFIHLTKISTHIDIFETVESCYVPGENFRVVQYNSPKYSPEAIIHSAVSSLNFCREAKPDSYSVCLGNCEHKIREFVVGKKISLQVRNFLVKFANILMFIFCIASWFMSGYIRMFTFVAFCIYCISFIYLAMDLSTHYKKDKIICGSCLKDKRIEILCYVTIWTLFIFYPEKCALHLYLI